MHILIDHLRPQTPKHHHKNQDHDHQALFDVPSFTRVQRYHFLEAWITGNSFLIFIMSALLPQFSHYEQQHAHPAENNNTECDSNKFPRLTTLPKDVCQETQDESHERAHDDDKARNDSVRFPMTLHIFLSIPVLKKLRER